MFKFELEKGSKKFTCPKCRVKSKFVRYQDENGNYLSDDVGRCDRESSCGYHKKPKDLLIENSNFQSSYPQGIPIRTGLRTNYEAGTSSKKIDYIEKDYLLETLANYEENAFVQFLLSLFHEDTESVQQAVKDYLIGTFLDHYGAYTCFSYLDSSHRFCRGKLIRFNQVTGKRLKGEFDTSSIVSKLKLKDNFQYKQILFGEHLIKKYPERPIGIVEAEKTAVIASISKGLFPDLIWLAAGSCTNLSVEKLHRFKNRKIILYPDANKSAFERWQKIASDARLQGLNVTLSTLLERQATDQEKAEGYDLADYLIKEQRQINEYNSFVDAYNAKVDQIQSDSDLRCDLNFILEERKAVMMYDGKLSEAEAERFLHQPEQIQQFVSSLLESY